VLPNNNQQQAASGGGWLGEILLLFLSAILFFLAHPNPFFPGGLGFLGYFALIPVFYLVPRLNWPKVLVYGPLLGFITYTSFNYWLVSFHPLAIFLVPGIYTFYYFVLFIGLKIVSDAFQDKALFPFLLVWMAYAYLRTNFFLGYPYGILGYTQWAYTPLIQIADLTGVWGVTALVVFPGIILGLGLQNGWEKLGEYLKKNRSLALGYGALFLLTLAYGFIAPVDYSQAETWRPALIQHEVDPWDGGDIAYQNSLDRLKYWSQRAMDESSPEAIVWSETAFVPSIHYHTRYRPSPTRYRMVRELLEFVDQSRLPFLFGNGQGERIQDESGQFERIDFNAAIYAQGDELKGVYRKTHLVPFTEHFPYEKILPFLHEALMNADTHYWEKGQEYTVFDLGKVKVSTPICFEDTFGYHSRELVRAGAEVLVNMTNDSWSGSTAAMMQHGSMAVFRAVENRRSMVRSSNGGWTAGIDPNGKVIDELPTFTQNYLTVTVPIIREVATFYTFAGDYLAILFLIGGLGVILWALVATFSLAKVDKKIDS
jgi:apolipoprotein N-acyltransferase